jgi:hypothetical protein
MFTHVVLFWLDESAPPGERDSMIADCAEVLKKIPTVRQIWAGRPAMTDLDIVDNSYDVGLCVVYDDKAGHDVYQDHPLHEKFVAKHEAHWKRVQVFDFV